MSRDGGIRQKRSLGQVFLKVDWPLERIEAVVREHNPSRILEIGPGGAVLTRRLAKLGIPVTAVEKDDRFAARLQEEFAGTQVAIENVDILKFDLAAWIGKGGDRPLVVGNIPYNISSPILMMVLPLLPQMAGAVFMTQLEFAKRLVGRPGTKDYGSLSVFAQLRSRVELHFEVPRGCFKPVPKVDSAVFSLAAPEATLPAPVLDAAEKVCRAAFNQRRKKLRNSVAGLLGDRDPEGSPVDLTLRADAIGPADYVRLGEFLTLA